MPKIVRLACLLAVAAAMPLCAKPIEIKLASIAPRDSPWGAGLEDLAAAWKKITNGEVDLKIYHYWAAGERDIIRKMKLKQLQGGVFTSMGLNDMNDEVLTLSIPLFIKNEGELDYVLERTRPYLSDRFRQRGYEVLAWSKAGWLRFFSKKPVVYPEDLKRQRLGVNPSEQSLQQAFKTLGFSIVPVETPEVLTALNSGMIDAAQTSALGGAANQWFGIAKYLADILICPFLGAIVVTEQAWNEIPERYRPQIRDSLTQLENSLSTKAPALESQALDVMLKNGLVIPPMTDDARKKWIEECDAATSKLVGTTFSADMYARVREILKEYRSK
jgi:TRAP-type C4-dicarboxylate transport system substrate-binding protein